MQESFFKGLKVVEFAGVLAGPAVGMFFAELGAEVIKIENKTTGGDVTRAWKQPVEDPASPISAYWCSVNYHKTCILMDLTDPLEQARARELALEADLVLSNFKPSSARKMGMDAQTLRQANPRLIYAQLYAFADPEDERPAFDVVLQAEAGFLYMTGEPGRPPVKMPVALIDLLAAHQLKEGVLMALLHRERSGQGCVVSTSLLESALASLANQAGNYLMNGQIPQPMGTRHPNIAPYGDTYACSDGQLILLAVGTERQFSHLCKVLGLENLTQHPDFQTNSARVKNREALNTHLAERFLALPLEDTLQRLHQAAVPAARIRDMASVFEMPAAREMVLPENLPDGTPTLRVKTVAFKLETQNHG